MPERDWRIDVGDCRDVLRQMPVQSVHTVVTSPPYFGLRDYGTGEWEGGDPACIHRVGGQVADSKARGAITAGVRPGVDASRCLDCGARRVDQQIGLEPTPDEFVAALVAVFREVRRVLRDDGTVWLNLGDSYSSSPPGNKGEGIEKWKSSGLAGVRDGSRYLNTLDSSVNQKVDSSRLREHGIKPKDLIGIPWLVAFALRADGWYLRSEIIWAKRNCMPESVTDRPTRAHETIFLLSKSPRYYFDSDAIREDDSGTDHPRAVLDGQASLEPSNGLRGAHNGIRTTEGRNGSGRNKRSVWWIATQPFSGWIETVRRVRVAADDADDDTTRIASADCPVHGSMDRSGPTGDRDGRAAGDPTRSHDSGADPAQAQQLDSAPTGLPPEPSTQGESSDSMGRPCAPAATPHSTGSRRTDPAPATSPACTPSAGTTLRTDDTSASRECVEPRERRPASSSATADSPAHPSAGTPDRTSRSASCTCEYYRETTEKTSHFATFPPKLIEPCILAGAPERACGECGAPWVRQTESHIEHTQRVHNAPKYDPNGQWQHMAANRHADGHIPGRKVVQTLGFEPSCSHGDGSALGLVLDPFAGAGTTGLVALQHGREFVGIELNPEYAAMARERIETAVRLGFRPPQNGSEQIPGQESLFG